MADKYVKKTAPGRGEVSILAETYDPGTPEGETTGDWRHKASSRDEKIKYLQTAEAYWFAKERYGSEKRKNPA